MIDEEWREIPGWEGLYQASSIGNIRNSKTKRVLKPWLSGGNIKYLYISLGASWKGSVHRLICSTFHGLGVDGEEVCHNDGNPLNNSSDNLRWATHAENVGDAKLHGTHAKWEKMPHSKLTNEQASEIRQSADVGRRLAERYGVSPALVCYIRKARRRHQ